MGVTVWRAKQRRVQSSLERLAMAETLWRWQPHKTQRGLFCSGASVPVAACGRRWGKTECLSVDIATLALAERGCRQILVAPTHSQTRLLGEAVRDRLEKAFAQGDPEGKGRTVGRDGRNLREL